MSTHARGSRDSAIALQIAAAVCRFFAHKKESGKKEPRSLGNSQSRERVSANDHAMNQRLRSRFREPSRQRVAKLKNQCAPIRALSFHEIGSAARIKRQGDS
jgi:hypothetical protein